MKTDHIKVRRGTDGVDVVADDYELFDYIDDVLTDRGFESEYTREEECDGKRYYTIHFGDHVSEELIRQAIDELSEEEVERLYQLNN